MGKGILNRGTRIHKVNKKYNRRTMESNKSKGLASNTRTVWAERMSERDMDISDPPKIGDKVYFEVDDTLHENDVRLVYAKIIRSYPKKRGNSAYLAYDCEDLDKKGIFYTVPYDQEFIKTDPR
jgi:hypothetical protein